MNKFLQLITLIILTMLTASCKPDLIQQLSFEKLLCEYATEPIGIDVKRPRFSWIMESTQRGHRQTAFRIKVATSVEKLKNHQPDMWDTDRINSAQTVHYQYDGTPLESNRGYYWMVTVWDNHDNEITSRTAKFNTALLNQNEWTARWIGAGPVKEPRNEAGFFKNPEEQYVLPDTVVHNGRSVLLRKEFNCIEKVKSARIFVTGLGYYEIYINGKKVGNHVLNPAKTQYRKQVLYDTYDVSNYLSMGQNAIGIHLGNGWFNPYKKWWREYRMQWFGAKRAIMQMHVEYFNGTRQIFTTDKTWKYAPGPVLFNCVYDGELYDATADHDDWSKSDFDDSDWQNVNLVEAPGGKMISQLMPPIKVVQTLKPVKTYQPEPGVQIYDMGQNFTGWVRVALKGTKGTKLTLRFAEDIHENGTIDATSNERAKATAVYVLKGKGIEIYEPRFTFFGYKYVELTAEPALPVIEKIEGCVAHSANQSIGTFECGNELINKIHHATRWSQKSNMIGYPLDCPQRDERLGWFGDAQVTAEEAMFNFDMTLFNKNWLSGIKLNQDVKTGDIPIISPRPYIKDDGVEWSSTYLIMVWLYYLYYGDNQILSEHYNAMKRYMEFLDNISDNYITPKGWIGDWGSLVEGWQEGEPESVPTAFYYFNAVIMTKIANILNKTEDKSFFADLSKKIRKAYNDKYFNTTTRNYNDGSQMANAFPLYLNIVPEKHQKDVLNNLVEDIIEKQDGHLTTGVLGTKYMIDALSGESRSDVAWIIVTQTGYPSWSDMMEKYTTMCEFWTLKQSHNHVMMGSIDAWFYKSLAGIQIDEKQAAFENIIIKPFLARDLTYTRASVETIRGTVSSEWEINESGLNLNVGIPFNATADIYIPAGKAAEVFESGRPVKLSDCMKIRGYKDNHHIFSVESGKYEFTVTH